MEQMGYGGYNYDNYDNYDTYDNYDNCYKYDKSYLTKTYITYIYITSVLWSFTVSDYCALSGLFYWRTLT